MGKLIRNGQEFGGAAEQASRISYDNSDSIIHATNLQSAIDELAGGSQSLFVPTIRTINGLDLLTDRILKSAQFAESVTGEKMLANLLYSQVNTWDSGAKKSIKLEGDTYLDDSGVVTTKHHTLRDALDLNPFTVDTSNITLTNCTGTVSMYWAGLKGNTAQTEFVILFRGRIMNFVRQGGSPSLTFNTSARPASAVTGFGGYHTQGGTTDPFTPHSEVLNARLATDGKLSLQMSESYENMQDGFIIFLAPQIVLRGDGAL